MHIVFCRDGKKSDTELKLADPAIHREDQKPRLLEALERQQQLTREEAELLVKWEEVSTRIEQAS